MPYDNLDIKVGAITMEALNRLTVEGVRIFKEEIPRKSGKLRDNVKMTPARKFADGTIFSEIIIDSKYARAVDKGILESANQIQTASRVYMVFSDWPNGPDSLRWKDGNFRFKTVRHHAPANNFSQRAIRRIRIRSKNIMRSKIGAGIKKALGLK